MSKETVSLQTIIKKIHEGLESQGMWIWAGPGTGSMAQAMKPIAEYLNKRGVNVK